MKCIILAAGYATRMYPLTENFPKPLLEVKGKPIIDWLIDDLETKGYINEYIVVSNHKFLDSFKNWKESNIKANKITVIDDGSTENDNRLGAVRDIQFAVETQNIDEDIVVLAGDNLLNFSLNDFVEYFYKKNGSCVMRHFESSIPKLQKTGVADIDEDDRVLEMEEKPAVPKTNWAIPPFYIYKKEDLSKIAEGIAIGCPTDAPGNFLSWLCKNTAVYAMEMPGVRYDIGSIDGYEDIKANYKGIKYL